MGSCNDPRFMVQVRKLGLTCHVKLRFPSSPGANTHLHTLTLSIHYTTPPHFSNFQKPFFCLLPSLGISFYFTQNCILNLQISLGINEELRKVWSYTLVLSTWVPCPQSPRTSGCKKGHLKTFATTGATVPKRKQTEKGSHVFPRTWGGPLCPHPQSGVSVMMASPQ